jgi:hypothetical protein
MILTPALGTPVGLTTACVLDKSPLTGPASTLCLPRQTMTSKTANATWRKRDFIAKAALFGDAVLSTNPAREDY